ncbi:MAG: type II secretion system protein [Proteobacteria bacterium]|nr:type II secretion system protein [Pseudomonadota bacterium]
MGNLQGTSKSAVATALVSATPPDLLDALPRRRRRLAGFWLTEVLVATMLVSMVLIPVLGLFPMGRGALKQAEHLQTATSLARQAMSTARATKGDSLQTPAPDASIPAFHSASKQTVNGVDYSITYDMYAIHATPNSTNPTTQDATLMDVVVKVEWNGMQAPVVYSSRIYKNYLGFQKNETVKNNPDDPPSATPPTPAPGSSPTR